MSEPSQTKIGDYRITRTLPGPREAFEAVSAAGDRLLIRTYDAGDHLEQVRREVEACRSLDHPAMARAVEVFDHQGKLAVVFPYFDGVPLERILRKAPARKKVDETAIWLIGHQIAGALAQAHSATDDQGDMIALCHGHLSPAQVVVSRNGQLRVEGFGLAALVGQAELPAAPGYQAPEQARGGRATPRGDLYSVAALLWALLTRQEPTDVPAGALGVTELADRMPSQLCKALERALEPSLGKRKITSMELEQWLSEAVDESAGRKALGGAARAMVQSGRTLVGGVGGPAMLGLMGRPPAGSEPDPEQAAATPAAPADAPAAPAPAAKPGESSAAAKARAIGARGGGSPVRSRQRTLLGTAAFSTPTRPKPATGPRQAIARDLPERAASPSKDAPAGTAGASPVIRSSASGPKLPDLDWSVPPEPSTAPPSSRRKPPPPLKSATDEPSPASSPSGPPPSSKRAPPPLPPKPEGPPDEAPTVVRQSAPGLSADEAGAPSPSSVEPPTVERELERDDPEMEQQAIEEMILGATVGAATDPPVAGTRGPTTDIDDLIAEPLADSKAAMAFSEPPAAGGGAAVAAGGSPWKPPAAPARVELGAEQPLSIGKMIAIALGTAVLVMAAGVWWVRSRAVLSDEVPPSEPAATTATAGGSAGPTASAAVTAATGAQPTSSASASAAAAQAADGSDLPASSGLLVVLFSGSPDAKVYNFGKLLGSVGDKLEAPCGRAFLRVGTLPGPTWVSAGVSVEVRCQALTEVKIEPVRP